MSRFIFIDPFQNGKDLSGLPKIASRKSGAETRKSALTPIYERGRPKTGKMDVAAVPGTGINKWTDVGISPYIPYELGGYVRTETGKSPPPFRGRIEGGGYDNPHPNLPPWQWGRDFR